MCASSVPTVATQLAHTKALAVKAWWLCCRNAFVQVQDFVQQRFPGTEVLGTTYPVATPKVLLARGVLVLQIGIAAVALAGEQIFQALNVPPPQLYLQYKDKKGAILLGAWFIGNMFQNSLLSTGAFEVYSNGQQVRSVSLTVQGSPYLLCQSASSEMTMVLQIFSKLQTNRMPSIDELMEGLVRTLQPEIS